MVNPVPVQSNQLVGTDGKPNENTHRWMQSVKKASDDTSKALAVRASTTQTWEQSFFLEYPDAKDYRVVLNSQVARTISNVTTKCSSGTCTLVVKINAAALGGAANSVSTSEQSQAHSSANAVAVGDDIVLTVSAVSSVENVSVLLSGTVTLA